MGQCLGLTSSDELFANPVHPYTQALLSAIPEPDIAMRNKEIKVIKGEVVSPWTPSPAAGLPPAASIARSAAIRKLRPLKEVSPGHFVACHLCDN